MTLRKRPQPSTVVDDDDEYTSPFGPSGGNEQLAASKVARRAKVDDLVLAHPKAAALLRLLLGERYRDSPSIKASNSNVDETARLFHCTGLTVKQLRRRINGDLFIEAVTRSKTDLAAILNGDVPHELLKLTFWSVDPLLAVVHALKRWPDATSFTLFAIDAGHRDRQRFQNFMTRTGCFGPAHIAVNIHDVLTFEEKEIVPGCAAFAFRRSDGELSLGDALPNKLGVVDPEAARRAGYGGFVRWWKECLLPKVQSVAADGGMPAAVLAGFEQHEVRDATTVMDDPRGILWHFGTRSIEESPLDMEPLETRGDWTAILPLSLQKPDLMRVLLDGADRDGMAAYAWANTHARGAAQHVMERAPDARAFSVVAINMANPGFLRFARGVGGGTSFLRSCHGIPLLLRGGPQVPGVFMADYSAPRTRDEIQLHVRINTWDKVDPVAVHAAVRPALPSDVGLACLAPGGDKCARIPVAVKWLHNDDGCFVVERSCPHCGKRLRLARLGRAGFCVPVPANELRAMRVKICW